LILLPGERNKLAVYLELATLQVPAVTLVIHAGSLLLWQVCAFLKQLASCKFDIDMESVYTMLAEMLAAASVLDASPGPCQV
jgi:hypothetical protein